MRLIYFDASKGRNFGDLLNKPIFDHYLPGFFDDDERQHFLGIGSILGLPFAKSSAQKIVFSSGFAYGQAPTIDDTYDFVCVRGPLTAKKLKLAPNLAIADGAYLLRGIRTAPVEKKHECSIMLHWHSLLKFDWRPISEELGLNFIDPSEPVADILDKISASKHILAEAMHAAIAADAMRIPWTPIACYRGVNSFKWHDFTQSVGLDYTPIKIDALYMQTEYVAKVIQAKSLGIVDVNRQPFRSLLNATLNFRTPRATKAAIAQLKAAMDRNGELSKDSVCSDRFERLVDRIAEVKKKYRSTNENS
jgi:succinoglycan biosynthesis protein ExoV